MKSNSNILSKQNGQVFTPDYLVNRMLDYCGYDGKNVLQKHVIDNSCGNGAFLCQIVERYCENYLSKNNDILQLKADLEKYIHGIEIEDTAYNECVENLNNIARKYNIGNVKWDIKHNNTLNVSGYNNKMDFVIGNPPYIRVHNLEGNFKTAKI
jgi:adenine-specific DNA-methyltransferase